MVKKAIAAGILAGLVLFVIVQQFYKSEEPQAIEATTETTGINAGMAAPDFTLKNLAGEEESLKDYRGKKVMLNFWATCVPLVKRKCRIWSNFIRRNQRMLKYLRSILILRMMSRHL